MTVTAYCVRCAQTVPIVAPTRRTGRGGRQLITGTCPQCHQAVYTLRGRAA